MTALLACVPAWTQVVTHSGSISASETWSAADVHHVTGDVTVAAGAVLTIEAGTVVKLDPGTSITVAGDLVANGSDPNHISFTSIRDDNLGGDTDGDPANDPAPGDWDTIHFSATANPGGVSKLNFVDIFYGGASGPMLDVEAPFSSVRVTADHSAGDGVRIGDCGSGCAPDLRVDVQNCAGAGLIWEAEAGRIIGGFFDMNATGIQINAGSPRFRSFPYIGHSTGDGIHVTGGTPSLEEVEVHYSGGYGIFFEQAADIQGEFSQISLADNYKPARIPFSAIGNLNMYNNQVKVVEILGNRRDNSLQFMPKYTFHLVSGTATISQFATFELTPGMVWKMGPNTGFSVEGALIADGSEADPITFTSERDDSLGVALAIDDPAPADGDWNGIGFVTGADGGSSFDHVAIRYGGAGGPAALHTDGTSLALQNLEIGNSATHGFQAADIGLAVTTAKIYGNRGDGIHLIGTGTHAVDDSQIYANHGNGLGVADSVALTLTQSGLFANDGFGIDNQSSAQVTATGNWWGDAGGPGGGDGIQGDVDAGAPLAAGLKYYDFDAGGSAHSGFSLPAPVAAGGTASSEWGTTPEETILFNDVEKTMTLTYSGLSLATDGGYTVLVTYLNRDAGGSVQTLTDLAGLPIHQALELPAVDPVTYRFRVPDAAIDGGGNLGLRLTATSGDRVVVSKIMLLTDAEGEPLTPPNPPVVTNFTTVTDPADLTANLLTDPAVTLQGTRDDDTAILINGAVAVPAGVGPWSYPTTLDEGNTQLALTARDQQGLTSSAIYVNFTVDSTAPVVASVNPADGTFVNQANIDVQYLETGSGIDLAASELRLVLAGQDVAGTWQDTGSLIFTPDAALADGDYQLALTLVDNLGNGAASFQSGFTLDSVAPAATVVDPVTTPTGQDQQMIAGSKEAHGAVYLDGAEIVAADAAVTWSYNASLMPGSNDFSFTVRDRAGNESHTTQTSIFYDNVAPGPVAVSTDGQGNGTAVALDWTGYDEAANGGDIALYRIYRSATTFTDIAQAQEAGTTPAGTKTASIGGLQRDTTTYFAVVAEDQVGNLDTQVTATGATTLDVQPPENITGLIGSAGLDQVILNWTASADSAGDLAGYRLYLDGTPQTPDLDAAAVAFAQTGLANGTTYGFRLTAFDDDGNENAGVTLDVETLLANPTGLAATPDVGLVQLSWDAVQPGSALSQYRVYFGQSDFISVSGLTPALTTAATSAEVTGLEPGQTYYFAVTAVNQSGGEYATVQTIAAVPLFDNTPPAISAITWNGAPLTDGTLIESPGALVVQASDDSGLQRVTLDLDGAPIADRPGAGPSFSFSFDPLTTSDGSHTLTFTAVDIYDNSAPASRTIDVQLAAPGVPVVSQPTAGTLFNRALQFVTGTAQAHADVVLYLNGLEQAPIVTAPIGGQYSIPVTLVEGANLLEVAARNRGGESAKTAPRTVTLDTSVPPPPTGVEALARESGVVQLDWRTAGVNVPGFNLYRAAVPFDTTVQATKINGAVLTVLSFQDLTPADGDWYYRLTSVNGAGTESDLSAMVTATSDRLAPRVVSIDYEPEGPTDPGSGRIAPGRVNVTLELSEPLLADPFFTVTSSAGLPLSAQLQKVGDTTYTGHVQVEPTTATGTAYAVFSGRDTVGNRGTAIDAGGTLLLDTTAPRVVGLDVTPAVPIQNLTGSPAQVQAIVTLDEPLPDGTEPELGYLLTVNQTTTVSLPVSPLSSTQWQVTFTLPAAAGSPAESLLFSYHGVDDLGNESDKITVANFFEIYQDGLPPLATPTGLTLQAQAGGQVAVSWGEVEDAPVYQLYRQAPGESQLTELIRVPGATSYLDQTSQDGLYNYAVASVRQENGQEAVSPMSLPAGVTADSVAPPAPENLTLLLAGNGIFAQWDEPAALGEPVTYRLYRADSLEITSVAGLTAVADHIPQTSVVDPFPSMSEHAYAVTAVDAAGNESLPSESYYLNFELLPVDSLTVTVEDGLSPVVSWTHGAGSIAGYHVYNGAVANGVRLNAALIDALSFTDGDYPGGSRTYTVVAVDDQNVVSPERGLRLPDLSFALAEGSALRRGTMNQLLFAVTNHTNATVASLRLKYEVAGIVHQSEAFSLEAGETLEVPVIVGGYDTLSDEEVTKTTLEHRPNMGELVALVQNDSIAVQQDLIAVETRVETFTRGGVGQVRFALHNTSPVELELLTATSSGNNPSNEIRFRLLDADDNVLASAGFTQALGEGVVTLPDKRTVARISAGGSFISDAVALAVPADAPDNIFAQTIVDQFHYRLGTAEHVAIAGVQSRREVMLVETSYDAAVTAVSPTFSFGDEPVVITGQATERSSGQPLGLVPVKLIVANRGFERTQELYSGEDGSFSYSFVPAAGDGGVFEVKASHPELVDTPVQDSFTISRVTLTPEVFNLRIPRNYAYTIKTKVKALTGTTATNLSFAYLAEDQPNSQLQEGLQFDPQVLPSLSGGSQKELRVNVAADNRVPDAGTFVLRLTSAEAASWTTLRVNYILSGIEPSLHYAPSFVETGVATGDAITETVTLENRGLADMDAVTLALLAEDDSPAPAWLVLNGPHQLGTLAVGEMLEVGITFSPDAGVPTSQAQPYAFKLRVAAANAPTTDINLFCFVDQSGMGHALFKVTDLYTGTLDEGGQVIQGLQNAKIRLIKEEGSLFETTLTTDSLGEAFFQDLPVGRYSARVTATKRNTWQGRIWVKPGLTLSEHVHLDADLITVEWEVVPTTIQDVYDIVLTAIFETNVPAAVVVAEPASVTLPHMAPGDTYYGEFYLTNYGLTRADELKATPRPSTHYKMELLYDPPESLEARDVARIPYRVTMISPLVSSDGSGSGGGTCGSGSASVGIAYEYECQNGDVSNGNTLHTAGRAEGDCGSGGTVTSGNGSHTSPDSGGGFGFWDRGTGSGTAPKKCKPKCKKRNKKCCKRKRSSEVGSYVDLMTGEYWDEVTDIWLKVMGHRIEIVRYYNDGEWTITDFADRKITFSFNNSGEITKMSLLDWDYVKTSGGTDRWVAEDGSFISAIEGGFRWQARKGDWEEYDASGKLIAYGNRNQVRVSLLSDAGGRLFGIQDHFGEQVLFFEYDAQDRIIEVRDSEGRQVFYEYDPGGNLVARTDVMGNQMSFEYDGDNRLIEKRWPNGKERHIRYDQYGRVKSVVDNAGRGSTYEYSFNEATKENYTIVTNSNGVIKESWYDRNGETIRQSVNGVAIDAVPQKQRGILKKMNGMML